MPINLFYGDQYYVNTEPPNPYSEPSPVFVGVQILSTHWWEGVFDQCLEARVLIYWWMNKKNRLIVLLLLLSLSLSLFLYSALSPILSFSLSLSIYLVVLLLNCSFSLILSLSLSIYIFLSPHSFVSLSHVFPLANQFSFFLFHDEKRRMEKGQGKREFKKDANSLFLSFCPILHLPRFERSLFILSPIPHLFSLLTFFSFATCPLFYISLSLSLSLGLPLVLSFSRLWIFVAWVPHDT